MEDKEIIIMRDVLYHSLYGPSSRTDVVCVFKGQIKEANKYCKEKTSKSRNCIYYTKKVSIHKIKED